MPGFYVSDINMQAINEEMGGERLAESFETDGFHCARCTLDKFVDDKVFAEDDAYVVIAEGVVTNKAELFAEAGSRTMNELVIGLYEEQGERFFEGFRGSFSGALYDRARDRWVFYTNHYGDNALFYYCANQSGGGFVFGSHPTWVLGCLGDAGVSRSVDERAVCAMLTYAFMIDDRTYAREVKRLLPGHYAVVEGGRLRIERYYRPKDRVIDVPDSEAGIVDELDRLFRQAVRREFDKDAEYGYLHLCDLSGGLDSRMTTWVARDMGYGPCLNLTYSQSGYVDEIVAEQIADRLGNDILFKPLDSANFLLDAERLVAMNAGLSLYSGITGGERLLRALNLGPCGLEHTGQLGDVVLGSYVKGPNELYEVSHAGMYSQRLAGLLDPVDTGDWRDREQYMMCIRGFLGILGTHFLRRNYTEVASPFLDVDFLDFCMSIPVELRAGHRLYEKWIVERYPEAAGFVWEKRGTALTANRASTLLARARRKARSAVSRMMPANALSARSSMNPMEHWYETKPALREWMDEQMRLPRFGLSQEFASLLDCFFENGSALEKTQAITVAHALRLYFGD